MRARQDGTRNRREAQGSPDPVPLLQLDALRQENSSAANGDGACVIDWRQFGNDDTLCSFTARQDLVHHRLVGSVGRESEHGSAECKTMQRQQAEAEPQERRLRAPIAGNDRTAPDGNGKRQDDGQSACEKDLGQWLGRQDGI